MHPVQFALLMKLAGSRVDGTVDTQPAALRRGRISGALPLVDRHHRKVTLALTWTLETRGQPMTSR